MILYTYKCVRRSTYICTYANMYCIDLRRLLSHPAPKLTTHLTMSISG